MNWSACKRVLAGGLAAMLLFAFAGCIEGDMSTQVKEDGSGSRVISVTMPFHFRSALLSDETESVSETGETVTTPPPAPNYRALIFPPKAGWTVKEEREEENVRFTGRRDFQKTEDLNSVLSRVTFISKASFFTVDYVYEERFKWNADQMLPSYLDVFEDPAQKGALLEKVMIRADVVLPGSVSQTNGIILEENRARLSFTARDAVELEEGVVLMVRSRETRWERIVVLIGILLILFILLIFAILRKGRSRSEVTETITLE